MRKKLQFLTKKGRNGIFQFAVFSIMFVFLLFSMVNAQDYQASNVSELRDAITNAGAGEVIAVAGGEYVLEEPLNIAAGYTIEGGYSSDFSTRDVASNETIIDGDNSVIVFQADGTTDWVIDGLTITGGFAEYKPTNMDPTGQGADRISGSALRMVNGAVGVLQNVKITKNNVSSLTDFVQGDEIFIYSNNGCGIYLGGASNLTIMDSEISENYSEKLTQITNPAPGVTEEVERELSAGVIYANTNSDGMLTLKNTDIINNPSAEYDVATLIETAEIDTSWGVSGGPTAYKADTLGWTETDASIMVMEQGNIILENVTFENNCVAGDIIDSDGSAIRMEKCLVKDNYTDDGIISLTTTASLIKDTRFTNSVGEGGFIYNGSEEDEVQVSMFENIIVEHCRAAHGRFMYQEAVKLNSIKNSIIRHNHVAPRGDRLLEQRSQGSGPESNAGLSVFTGNIVEYNLDPRRPLLEWTTNRAEISNNIIRGNDSEQSTLQMEPENTELLFFNNVIYDNVAHAPSEEGWILENKDNNGDIKAFNNTFYNNETDNLDIVGFDTESLTLVGYKNNLFYSNVADSGESFLFGTEDFNEEIVDITHNLVGDWDGKVAGWDPHEPPFFAPNENNNIDIGSDDPGFLDAKGTERNVGPGAETIFRNLSLSSGSPAVDAGINPSDWYENPYPSLEFAGDTLRADPTKDINGVPRDANWDIGAYEGAQPNDIDEKNTVNGYELSQNYPNPFNPVTNIEYKLKKAQNVKIDIYNLAGKHVKTLVNKRHQGAGKYKVKFNANNLASGVYFYRMETDNFSKTRKMLLIK